MAVKRERVRRSSKPGGSYFASPKTNIKFIGSGCTTLDLALGGGWAEGRIGNIVGDKSSGKTLLCIEAAANFGLKYDNGRILYRECESAFDQGYAQALGMPVDRVEFDTPFETVEDLFEDLHSVVNKHKTPTLYIVDSLDALSDRAEMKRDMDEGSYGTQKAKMMSQLFRRLVRKMSDSNVTVLIVSQVRTNIGATFGNSTTRSGGRALDFYASQVLYLRHMKTVKRTKSGVERPVGIDIRAKVSKNKIGLPYREVPFHISFGYGVDDIQACVNWLKAVGSLKEAGIPATGLARYVKQFHDLPDDEFESRLEDIHDIVKRRWYEIEESFMPRRSKYG